MNPARPRRTRFRLLVFGILLGVEGPASQTRAQAVYGSVAGFVTDVTGAAVPGATVSITSPYSPIAADISAPSAKTPSSAALSRGRSMDRSRYSSIVVTPKKP